MGARTVDKKHVRMICTVGTSFNYRCNDGKNLLWDNKNNEKLLQESEGGLDSPLCELMRTGAMGNPRRLKAIELLDSQALPQTFDEFTFPTAEIQTLVHWLKDNREQIETLHVVLLPSEDVPSRLTAHAARIYLNAAQHLFPTRIQCGLEDILPTKIEVADREKFLRSVAVLFEEFDRQVDQKGPEQPVFCTSGGYKSIVAFAVMYAQLHSIPCLYTFENGPQAFELMHIPLGYAIGTLDEEISLLKAIGSRKGQTGEDLESNLGVPQWVSDTRPLAPMLIKSYERGRRQPCGTGAALFDRLRNAGDRGRRLAQHLERLLAENWAELWMGDQIPETVEHSRRHSKRLMEFASNLFRCAGPQMEALLSLGEDPEKPELLALLIASIYLHDIGHTALSFPVRPTPGRCTPFPLGLFPSAVREVHHLLTGELLRQYPERFFGEEHDCDPFRFLKLCVPFLSEHHRGYTALMDGDGKPSELIGSVGKLLYGEEKFKETLRPLKVRFEEALGNVDLPFTADGILKATALLRVIDGCDVQSDRVISREYLRARLDRTQDEAKFLSAQLEAFALPQQIAQPFSDLKQATSRLDVKQVLEGTFVDEDEVIKTSCRAIYLGVFQALDALRQKHPSAEDRAKGDWGKIQTEEALSFAGLSLANRVAFKWEQFLHFYKHQSVGFVLPVRDSDKEVSVRLYPVDATMCNENTAKIMESIEQDIEGEYKKAKSVLEEHLILKARTSTEGSHD
ncbi:hypothetical protein FF3_00898 [Fretibacterium fastidiosum]|uniref:CRISPR-associated protein (Cas_APE2256) n=1 Tax=Fretibacterium fastidiosum TaxID=651822 RepID=A0AB94IYF6_9BACT|nr:CRISPR-associated protein (Cas_APE2256) [Fretibacterium fastidiosum]